MLVMMKCVAEAIVAKGVKGLAEIVPGGQYLFDVANEALRRMRDRQRATELRAEVMQAAQATNDEAKKLAEQVAREVASSASPEDRIALELYLTQIPGAVRQSLRRADDPAGRSVPADFGLNDAADLLKRLPSRPAKFRPGDALPGKPGWQLVELLGTGGFGEVWLARNPSLSALKGAVKFGLDPQTRDRLLRHEGSLVNRVMEEGKHPNVVQLLDAHLDGDAPWLMYEYVPGGDLTGLIFAWQSLPPDERVARVTAALRTLASAVGHFHRLRPPLVHRDLKPANILISGVRSQESGVSKTGRAGDLLTPDTRLLTPVLQIADFGIGGVAAAASLAENATRRSVTGYLASQLWGSHTPLYASPQQQRGDKPDPRDDVHALGVIGFQMLTGKLDATLGADYAKTLRRFGVPDPLVELLGDFAAHDADNRPKDAAELADRLAACGVARSTPPERPRAKPVTAAPVDPPPRPLRAERPKPVPGEKTIAGASLLLFAVAVCLGVPLMLYALLTGGGGVTTMMSKRGATEQEVEKKVTITGVQSYATDVFFSLDGGYLATVSDLGHAVVWDLPAGGTGTAGKFLNWEAQTNYAGMRPAFSPDGSRFAIGSPAPGAAQDIGIFQTGTTIKDFRSGLDDRPQKLAFSSDGQWLVAGGATNGWVKVWDTAGKLKAISLSPGGGPTHTLDNQPCGVAAVEFAPDGKRLLTAGGDTVRLWKPETWPNSLAPEASFTHSARITAAGIDPRGRWVGAGATNGVTRIWDVDKPVTPHEQAKTGQVAIKQLALSSARHVAALDTAGVGFVWEARNPDRPTKIDWHGKDMRVNAVAFNPEGSLLATAGDDKTVRFWDTFTGRPHPAAITGHEAAVTAIAFTPDGNHLAVADAGGTVIIWQVPNPKKKPGD